MTPVLGNTDLALLELANVVAGALTGVKLALYTDNVVFNPLTAVLADFTLATYTGHATPTLTWDTPSISDDGHPETHSDAVTFRPTDGVTPNDIYGYIITDSGGTTLLAGGSFDGAPLPMHSALDVIIMVITYRLDNSGYVAVVS